MAKLMNQKLAQRGLSADDRPAAEEAPGGCRKSDGNGAARRQRRATVARPVRPRPSQATLPVAKM